VFIPKDISITVKNQTVQQYVNQPGQTGPAKTKPVETNNTAIIAIAVGISVVALVVLLFCLRALYVKANFETFQKQAIEQQQRAITVGKVANAKVDGESKEVDPYTGKKLNDDFENLDEQYNPHHDFAIFGVGNKKGGGLQTLQEKMNCADDVEEAKNSSSEDEAEDVKRQPDYLKVNAQSMDESIRVSSAGVSSDEPLTQNNSARVNTPPSDVQYNLPEDQEIQEATEEEEEA
jgi:hypothetical protein